MQDLGGQRSPSRAASPTDENGRESRWSSGRTPEGSAWDLCSSVSLHGYVSLHSCECAKGGGSTRSSRAIALLNLVPSPHTVHTRSKGWCLAEMVLLRASAPARAAFRAANVFRTSSTTAPYNPPSPYSGVSFQPHPHSLPVDGFVGAVGNTPLVRKGGSPRWSWSAADCSPLESLENRSASTRSRTRQAARFSERQSS